MWKSTGGIPEPEPELERDAVPDAQEQGVKRLLVERTEHPGPSQGWIKGIIGGWSGSGIRSRSGRGGLRCIDQAHGGLDRFAITNRDRRVRTSPAHPSLPGQPLESTP